MNSPTPEPAIPASAAPTHAGMSMRTVKLVGPRTMRAFRGPVPRAGAGEVVVRIRAVGICGSDQHYFLDGQIGGIVAIEPLVLGHEFAGEISEVGSGVAGLTVGLRVAVDPAIPCGVCEFCLEGNQNCCPSVRFCGTPPTDGALQEYIAWPANLVHPLPDSVSDEAGALLEPLGVAIQAVDLGRIRLADRVAVLGAGPIGLLIARLARASGAVDVIVSEPNQVRRLAAASFAATATIDPGAEDPVAAIKRLTGGRGVDVAFEAAGVLETPQQAVDALKPAGTVVVVGICPDDQIPIKSTAARRKGVTIKLCRRMKHVYPRAIRLVERGVIDFQPLVTHRFGLDETAAAFTAICAVETSVIKAIVRV